MSRTTILTAAFCLTALVAVPACNETKTVTANTVGDPQATELAKAQPVELPPAIRSSKTYRCKDNSIVYVSFLEDDVSALVRDKEEEPPIAKLKAPKPGEPFVNEDGFKLSGSGSSVTYTSPDSGTLTCKG
ncbi:MAG TPA: hypothetical protein VGR19_03700 [Allosphingosinicella sp.]|nr:hypothetical protein [Allosphingosinicella sp.]